MARIMRNLTSRQDWLCAFGLSILAALPRLYRLDLAEFKLDEANHYRMAYSLAHGAWRWVGSTSSIGLLKPPLFVYAISLPMTLSHDPRVITGFLGLLAALAAGAFYLILRRFLASKAAFGAALLFALNPQAVLYARKLFTADLLPPLCTLFLAAGTAFLDTSRRRAGCLAILTTLSFALLPLTTFSPLVLLPALGLLLFERRRDLMAPHWLGAGAGLILPFAPYLLSTIPDIRRISAQVGHTSSSTGLSDLSSWIWTLLYGAPWPRDVLSVDSLAALSLAMLSLVGLYFLLNQSRRGGRGRWARFFLTWLCLSPLIALLVPVEIHPHYLISLYPLLFALPAAGVEFATRKGDTLGWVALVLLSLVAIQQARAWSDILRAAAAGSKGYGTPLGYWRRATEQARALADRREADEVLVVVPGDQPWDSKANILDALLSDTPHRVVDGYTTTVYPSHDAVLLIASEVWASARRTFACTQNLAVELSASPFGGIYRYRLWSPTPIAVSSCTEELSSADGRWASGVKLLGYDAAGTPQPGETLHITLHWEATRGPLDTDVHWFNHLEGRDGRRWGQSDLVGWPASRWRPGDSVLMHFDLPIAPDAESGPYVLRVGQYTYPDIDDIPTVDPAGNPVGRSVALPVPSR